MFNSMCHERFNIFIEQFTLQLNSVPHVTLGKKKPPFCTLRPEVTLCKWKSLYCNLKQGLLLHLAN